MSDEKDWKAEALDKLREAMTDDRVSIRYANPSSDIDGGTYMALTILPKPKPEPDDETATIRREVESLRQEVAALREALEWRTPQPRETQEIRVVWTDEDDEPIEAQPLTVPPMKVDRVTRDTPIPGTMAVKRKC
jgi:hypothetical protein